MKFGCAICICLNSENLICRTTDISKCFRGSLQLRDNESRLYLDTTVQYILNYAVLISTTEAVLKGEPIPEGVEIKADKRLVLEFVRVSELSRNKRITI